MSAFAECRHWSGTEVRRPAAPAAHCALGNRLINSVRKISSSTRSSGSLVSAAGCGPESVGSTRRAGRNLYERPPENPLEYGGYGVMGLQPCRPYLYRAQSEPHGQRGNYFCGSTTVFVDPSGAACMPGGLCPCGLSGGAPPDLVSSGPVQPCGCNWPFSSGGERPVVVLTSVFNSACAAANPHENIRQMAVIIIRIASSAWLTGVNRQGRTAFHVAGQGLPASGAPAPSACRTTPGRGAAIKAEITPRSPNRRGR